MSLDKELLPQIFMKHVKKKSSTKTFKTQLNNEHFTMKTDLNNFKVK